MIACVLLLGLAGQAAPGPREFTVPCREGAREPQLAVAADGHIALAWAEGGELCCASGAPGSLESHPLRQPAAGKLVYAIGMRRGPRIALLERDVLVLSAAGGAQGGGKDGDIWSWRTLPNQHAWQEPVRVNSVAGSAREGLHALASGPKGELYCAWIDLRAEKPQILGARSSDGGASWKDEVLISGEAEICPCCSPSAAFDAEGRVHVMWRGVREGARDMQLASSTAAGAKEFGPARKLGTGTWKLDACPMDGGALAPAPGGGVLAAWRRERQLFSASDERAEQDFGTGEQPWIARRGDGHAMVWLEKRGGRLQYLAPGVKGPETIAESANDPVLASTPDGRGALWCAWETPGEGKSRVHLARLDPR